MPATHVVPVAHETHIVIVTKNDVERPAHILQKRDDEVYVHYVGTDKRLDEWVPETCLKLSDSNDQPETSSTAGRPAKKRKRTTPSVSRPRTTSPAGESPLDAENGSDENGVQGRDPGEVVMTEEDFDIQHHKQITAHRNFDKVHFGDWQIKTWYFSPYPLIETEDIEPASQAIAGVQKTTNRSHGRTSDILAGGLGRTQGGQMGKSMLWVCEMCFKYMTDGPSWELHQKNCDVLHPPGLKVYQRGAHTIWEVDGAKAKLYCQNLSLFGKLFIDVKTLFFDCDNFLFYILTDATSRADHILGFFSKEKVSYDDYNLACIITLPPYQRKGYGILMIEFSYELSRRAGKVGTPERPLSDLGLRSYLAYWVSTLVRFFRRLLTVLPPGTNKIESVGELPDLRSPSREYSVERGASTHKRKKRTKGWDGEIADDGMVLNAVDDELFSSLRSFVTTPNPDGSASTNLVVRCTLADISRATNLRVEDAAFALNEVGLLARRLRIGDEDRNMDSEEEQPDEMIVLTRQMVEAVALERKVKIPCIRLNHVLL